MEFIGIDLHTNKFTCSYRDENTPPDAKKGKRTETFKLTERGLAAFYQTLTDDAYVLIEATITAFSFVRLIQPPVKEAIAANTYELKQISLARANADKIDANILSQILKMQVLAKERAVSPVVVPPEDIQELREAIHNLPDVQKTNHANQEPDTFAAQGKTVWLYPGRDF